jgi:hypothetical protein
MIDDNENDEYEHDDFSVFSGEKLQEAKDWVQHNLRVGARCPCCGQYCKLYRRKLNSTMCYALLLIYHASRAGSGWIHVPEFMVRTKADSTIAGGDVQKLRYWGLLERQKDRREDGSDRVGFYRITEVGKKFVEGKLAVPKYVYLYNQLLLRLSEEMVTVQEALGDRFSYDELMRS